MEWYMHELTPARSNWYFGLESGSANRLEAMLAECVQQRTLDRIVRHNPNTDAQEDEEKHPNSEWQREVASMSIGEACDGRDDHEVDEIDRIRRIA
jgi:hypothetical protein